MYFASISVTALSYVLEKKGGMLERTIVAGVSTTEIITAQFITHYVIIFLQTLMCLGVVFGIFKLEINDQIGWVILLILMQGCIGMLAGFFLSSICDHEAVVMQLSTALTMPCLILGGH
jgi:ABC-type transport system involved in cytochrome c biogenesis permease component